MKQRTPNPICAFANARCAMVEWRSSSERENVACSGAGVRVHLAGHASGHVAITDVHDGFVENAIESLKAGDFVRCRVLGRAEDKGAEKSTKEGTGALRPAPCPDLILYSL